MPGIVIALLFVIFACWGSFLNVVAYRLITGGSLITQRSACPGCKQTLAWYDLIPLISWFFLYGSCRSCKRPISFLYPLIEFITAVSLTLLALYEVPHYFMGHFLFFSALIVTIRTDIEFMLISRFVTLYLVPIGFLLSYMQRLPLTPYNSLVGAIGGYLFLYLVGTTFLWLTKKQGLGQGDLDLLALIGAFTGPVGCWTAILIGSIFGSCVGIAYMHAAKTTKDVKIPFGPFLALGAMTHIFLEILV